MKKLHVLTFSALLAPAITLGIGSAVAQSQASDSSQRAGQSQPAAHGDYLSSQPMNSFHAASLIGSDLKSRTDNESIGEVDDVLVDENGQIVAVIVEVGGLLGMGTKDVAISWNSVEHRLNEEGDGYDFIVNSTEETLKDAPEYKQDDRQYNREARR